MDASSGETASENSRFRVSGENLLFTSLKTSVWAPALIRRAQSAGAYATVLYKGDPDAGVALIKVRTLDEQAILYWPVRNMDGERVWLSKGPAVENEIDATIAMRLDTDPDLWVIEVEDRKGRHFLTETVEGE